MSRWSHLALARCSPAHLSFAASLVLFSSLAGCGRHHGLPTQSLPGAGNDIAGAVSDPNADTHGRGDDSGARGFYPLDIGDRWRYEVRYHVVIVTSTGPQTSLDTRTPLSDEIIGAETLFGRDYVVEEERSQPPSGPSTVQWYRFRQDPSGLYLADVSPLQPPALPGAAPGAMSSRWSTPATLESAGAGNIDRVVSNPGQRAAFRLAWGEIARRMDAARTPALASAHAGRTGGPTEHEIQVLRYPLRPGAHWVTRSAPSLISETVEGIDLLRLAAGRFLGFRLREDADFFGPRDRVRQWYGRVGFLELIAHFQATATDDNGDSIGVAIGNQSMRLDAVDLVGAKHHRAGDDAATAVVNPAVAARP